MDIQHGSADKKPAAAALKIVNLIVGMIMVRGNNIAAVAHLIFHIDAVNGLFRFAS